MTLLFQINGRLPVEALVFPLHVGEAREVIWVDEGQVHLAQRHRRGAVIKAQWASVELHAYGSSQHLTAAKTNDVSHGFPLTSNRDRNICVMHLRTEGFSSFSSLFLSVTVAIDCCLVAVLTGFTQRGAVLCSSRGLVRVRDQ